MHAALDPILAGLAGVVSTVVIAYFTAVFTRRREAASEYGHHAAQVLHDEALALSEYLKRAAAAIQNFRDTLHMIARAPVGTISDVSIIENVRLASDAYVSLYRDHVGAVPPDVARLTHDVKSVMLACIDTVRENPSAAETMLHLEDVRRELQIFESKIVATRLEHLQRYTAPTARRWL